MQNAAMCLIDVEGHVQFTSIFLFEKRSDVSDFAATRKGNCEVLNVNPWLLRRLGDVHGPVLLERSLYLRCVTHDNQSSVARIPILAC